MLRLFGALTLGNLVFGGRHCHCRHHHRRVRRAITRGILLGTLFGLFTNRENENSNCRDY
jgi:hypothetical protein